MFASTGELRLATELETLYLDFDGFFASVMQQVMPRLRDRPIGVIPFDTKATDSVTVIACSKEAKSRGVKNVMWVPDARKLCPEIILVPQRPDLFRRAHLTLLNEIECEIPIGAVKSIDELACTLDTSTRTDPDGLAQRIKARISKNIGRFITCSIGFAANRLLAKISCKVNKPDGVTIWHPSRMPTPLLAMPLSAIAGVGSRMEKRLAGLGVTTISELYETQPKQMRSMWGNVHGERMWYALHGYTIQAESTKRSMYGHGRVLPPDWRTIDKARECSRLLLRPRAECGAMDCLRGACFWGSTDLRVDGGSNVRWSASMTIKRAWLVSMFFGYWPASRCQSGSGSFVAA